MSGKACVATVERDAIGNAMGIINSFVKTVNTIPILSHVAIDYVQAGQIRLYGSDLDLAVSITLPAEVDSGFASTVQAGKFADIARLADKGAQIMMTAGDARLGLTSGRSRWSLQSLPRADYPMMAAEGLDHEFSLPSKELAAALERIRDGQGTNMATPYLNGVFLHSHEGKLRVAAMDGNRLHLSRLDVAMPAGSPDVILPTALVTLLLRVLADDDGDAEISVSSRLLRCRVGDVDILGKLMDAEYPNYRRIVPDNGDQMVTFDRAGFRRALERVAVVATDKSRGVRLEFAKGKVTVSSRSVEFGDAHAEEPCDYDGPDLMLGVNFKYASDMLDAVQSENVSFTIINIKDPKAPLLVRATPEDSFLGMLMPMNA